MPEILRMPEVAANTPEAVLANWNVELNKPYAAGDAIVTVETEKAVVDVEAENDGVLLRLLVDAGAQVEVGAPIAVWGTQDETAADVDTLLSSLGVESNGAQAAEDVAGADEPEAESSVAAEEVEPAALPTASDEPQTNGERIFASPLARKIARDSGLDLSSVVGSGPHGRIRRADVDAALANGVPAPAPKTTAVPAAEAGAQASFEDVPNTRLRQAIARRLTESKQTAPHFYVRGSARVDKLLALRREINDGGVVKVSVNDLHREGGRALLTRSCLGSTSSGTGTRSGTSPRSTSLLPSRRRVVS